MSTVTQNVSLTDAIIRRVLQTHGKQKFSHVVQGALQNVIKSTPAHRLAMMQAAMPIVDHEQLYGYPCDLPDDVVEEFVQFCESMKLRSDVLLLGSMLFLLEFALPPKDLPSFDEVCGKDLP